jgi:hypothetical protein
MANITAQEPIRWQIDQASFDASGLITIPGGLNCTTATSVDGFTITGSEPSGTARRIGFIVDSSLKKLDPTGALISIDDVEEDGNTVEDLAAITSVPDFVGKNVGVVVFLYAEDPDGQMPTIGIKALGHSASQQTVKVEESQVFTLGSDAQIIKLEASSTVSGGGTAVVEARINGGAWGALSSFKGLSANTVQFRVTLTAPNIGTSSAKVERASVQYRVGSGLVAGVGAAELISVTDDWHIGVRQCRMTVKHARFINSLQRAYVSFRDTPQIAAGEEIGAGTGESATYNLAHPNGVKYDSVRLYYDSQRVYSGYEVNTAVGRVTCTAPSGAVITIDYEYGWAPEVWHEMEATGTVPALEYDLTEYKYTLPPTEVAKSVCTIKIVMEVVDGHIDGEAIGAGTGVMKTYRLSHIVKDGKVTVYAGNVKISNWTLTDDARSVKVAASYQAALTVDYDWISETPEVYQFIAVFAE